MDEKPRSPFTTRNLEQDGLVSKMGKKIQSLFSIRDSRQDGVNSGKEEALLVQLLKDIAPNKTLNDLLKPGPQHLVLEYEEWPPVKNPDPLLKWLLRTDISQQSTWDIDLRCREDVMGDMSLLSEVFAKLPNISKLHWRMSFPIPHNLVKLLESVHPQCHLYYNLSFRTYGDSEIRFAKKKVGDKNLDDLENLIAINGIFGTSTDALMNCAVLFCLKANIVYGGLYTGQHGYKIDFVHRVLESCPNIRELDIMIGHHGFKSALEIPQYALNFQDRNKKLLPLEILKLNGYGLEEKPNGDRWMEWEAENPERNILKFPWSMTSNSVIQSVGIPKIKQLGGVDTLCVKRHYSSLKPGEKMNLDVWLERMDWSHLHTLELVDPKPETLRRLEGSTLPSLRNVSFSGNYNVDFVVEFIEKSASPLKSISL